ncbi:MAG: response regulator [Bacteroidota bacterium]
MMDDLKYAVICVDDDPHILQMLSFQLEKIIDTKCTLLEYFTSPQDALDNFDELLQGQIDVIFILVDFQMPGMNGAQLIRAIKLKKPDIACIMLSGQANTVQVAELEQDGLLTCFVHKPWDEATLFQVLKPIITSKS